MSLLGKITSSITTATPLHSFPVSGVGIVEGWRGAIVHRLEVEANGNLSRVKVVDPSFLNWPALSAALTDTIVPDFPLANKSFNLSYAGNDSFSLAELVPLLPL
jgi:Ni,Fe-hydrogenase III large subunit